MLPPHDGIRGNGWSHLSRAVERAPHEFPRSHPIPSSSRDASSTAEEVRILIASSPLLCCCRGPAEVGIIPPHSMKDDRELARDRDHRFLDATPASDRYSPSLEWIPATGTG